MSPFLAEMERDSGTGISLLVAGYDEAVLPLLGVLRMAPRLDIPVVADTNEVHLCGAKGVAYAPCKLTRVVPLVVTKDAFQLLDVGNSFHSN